MSRCLDYGTVSHWIEYYGRRSFRLIAYGSLNRQRYFKPLAVHAIKLIRCPHSDIGRRPLAEKGSEIPLNKRYQAL